MCVGSVCTLLPYNDKCPNGVFFLKSPFSNQAVLRFLSEWRSSAQAAPTIVDRQRCLTLDLPWVSWERSASGAGEDKNVSEHSSRYLLPASEPLKMQRINFTFIFERNAMIPDLPKYI